MKKEIIITVEIDPSKIHLEEEIEDKIAQAARLASLDFLDIHGVTGSWLEEILTAKEDSEEQKPTKDNLDLTFQVIIKCHKDFVDIVDNAARLQFGVFSHTYRQFLECLLFLSKIRSPTMLNLRRCGRK